MLLDNKTGFGMFNKGFEAPVTHIGAYYGLGRVGRAGFRLAQEENINGL